MSRRRDDYETSRWKRFVQWLGGETDPLMDAVEARPEEHPAQPLFDTQAAGVSPATGTPQAAQPSGPLQATQTAGTTQTAGATQITKAGKTIGTNQTPQATQTIGTNQPLQAAQPSGAPQSSWPHQASQSAPKPHAPAPRHFQEGKGIRAFRHFYQVMSVILCASIILVLLLTVAQLPIFGNAGNPDNNEVSARYIESGLQETGAVNIVTGMILDYRAFDTFGESCVLFIASCCVLVLLRIDKDDGYPDTPKRLKEASNDRFYEPKNDLILQKCASILVPLIAVFGIYIILNGHLSPGGGFSGGAVLGSGLILYLNAFGYEKTERFFTGKVYRRLTLSALTFYCLAKSYSFFTGANHLPSGIPLGTPGAILSSGLILPLNICVGLVVACTMYSFYTMFRKGGL